jgi:UDP-2,3-diacylglucosamine pyrophosphatase LpxH
MNLLFVSLSDLHLGEEDSVLTNLSIGKPVPEPKGPGPCMLALVNYLHAIKSYLNQGKPIPFLVLNGDILELATSSYPIAATYFRLFLSELAKRELFDRLIYLPGNHDHGLWSTIRDTHFIESLSRQSSSHGELRVEHTTSLSTPRQSPLLTLLTSNLPMEIVSPRLLVANPSFRLQSWQGHDFLFHHGHLLEDIYKFLTLMGERLMSDDSLELLKKKILDKKIGELEKENWPWIDFVWCGFARAGKVGETVEGIYELLSKPQGAQILIRRMADVLRTELDIDLVPEWFEDNVFRFILKKALKRGSIGSDERANSRKLPFSPDLREMTLSFMCHYMKRELSDEGLVPAANRSFLIFGHTHKPFLEELRDDESGFEKMTAVNSGGWVIESERYSSKYAPGIVIGSNAGDLALVKYRLDVKPGSEIMQKGKWDNTLNRLGEHKLLENAISRAVSVRRTYFRERVEKTEEILKNLSE